MINYRRNFNGMYVRPEPLFTTAPNAFGVNAFANDDVIELTVNAPPPLFLI